MSIEDIIVYRDDKYPNGIDPSGNTKWTSNMDVFVPVDEFYLNDKSVFFDMGGYAGKFSQFISDISKPNIFLFEPVKQFYSKCVDKFKNDNNIKCFQYGLGHKDYTFDMIIPSNETDASHSSEFSTGYVSGKKESCIIKEIGQFLKTNDIDTIDQIKINIEGGEYALINHLYNINYMSKIKKITIQFHEFVDNYKEVLNRTREQLKETHKLLWYNIHWEEWILKEEYIHYRGYKEWILKEEI